MNELPKIVRTRLGAASPTDHPDPDLLNAFAEQALRQDERQQVLAHLSACADCREVIALATSSAQATKATPSIDTGTPHSWFHWKVVRWGAAVACLVIVGSAVLMKRDSLMKPARVETAASQEAPVADRPAYESLSDSSPSPNDARREDAAINTALQPPSTQLTTRDRARLAENPAPPKSAPAAPNVGLSGKKIAGNLVAGVAGAPARSNLSPASPAAFSNAVTTPAQNESKSLAVQTRKVTDMSVPAASEMVEVEAGAPAVETAAPESARDKKEAFGKAKAAPAPLQLDQMANSTTETTSATKSSKAASKDLLAKTRHEQLTATNPPVSRWTISSDGQLQHSTDSGKTWQPVPIADHATFRALSANGPDIWAGGPSGLLYHSTDSGAYWMKVQPSADGAILNADIAAIEFTDIRHGKISTANGEVWLTEDAGQTWRKQP